MAPAAPAAGAYRPPLPWMRWGLRTAALLYLGVMLVIPLAVIVRAGLADGPVELWHAITQPVAWHALTLTLWTAATAAGINAAMGTLTAYVLVRYRFPGRTLLNALVDLPLAIPTLVTGIMLVVLYGPQQAIGSWLQRTLGVQIIFAPPSIVLALLFVTFPFVVRSVQPVLQELDPEPEAAALTLGARGWTTFRCVILPHLVLPLAGGTLLSFARGVGEFGAIVIVAGNIPFQTQTAAVYVYGEVESTDPFGADAMSVALLAIAFVLIVFVDVLQHRKAGRR